MVVRDIDEVTRTHGRDDGCFRLLVRAPRCPNHCLRFVLGMPKTKRVQAGTMICMLCFSLVTNIEQYGTDNSGTVYPRSSRSEPSQF